VNEQPLMPLYAGAHVDPFGERPDAGAARPARPLPRHRARRPHWKPPLEAVKGQHVHDREALVR
jgi:hypothetical protein